MRAYLPIRTRVAGWFLLDAGHVAEVLGRRDWIPIPGASPAVPGVLAWRGRAVGVLDLDRVAGQQEGLSAATSPRFVIVTHADHSLAVPVEEVREVKELPEAALRPAHTTRAQHAAGEAELEGVPMAVVDLASVIKALTRDPEGEE